MAHQMNITDRDRWRQARSVPTDWSRNEVSRWNESRRRSAADYERRADGAEFYRFCERIASRLFQAAVVAGAFCLAYVVLRVGIAFVDGSVQRALDAIRSAQ